MLFLLLQDESVDTVWGATLTEYKYPILSINITTYPIKLPGKGLDYNTLYAFFLSLLEEIHNGNRLFGELSMVHSLPWLASVIPNKADMFEVIFNHIDYGFWFTLRRGLQYRPINNKLVRKNYPTLVTEDSITNEIRSFSGAMREDRKSDFDVSKWHDGVNNPHWEVWIKALGLLDNTPKTVGEIFVKIDRGATQGDMPMNNWRSLSGFYDWMNADFNNMKSDYIHRQRRVVFEPVNSYPESMWRNIQTFSTPKTPAIWSNRFSQSRNDE